MEKNWPDSIRHAPFRPQLEFYLPSCKAVAKPSDPSKATLPVLLSGFCFRGYKMALTVHISLGGGEDPLKEDSIHEQAFCRVGA